jgi:hypothetical protein
LTEEKRDYERFFSGPESFRSLGKLLAIKNRDTEEEKKIQEQHKKAISGE